MHRRSWLGHRTAAARPVTAHHHLPTPQRAAAAADAGSGANTPSGYASADDDAFSYVSASPGSTRSGSMGLAFASAAVQAATAAAAGRESDDDEASSGGGRWVRVDSRRQRASSVGAGPSQARPQHWSHRQGTPPPQTMSRYLEQQSSGSGLGGGGSASRVHRRGEEQWRWQHAQHSQRDMLTPPPPARMSSWRRSTTRSPSPER